MHSKDYWNLQSGCLVNMSRCRNFTISSFVMVSKKKFVPYQSVMLLLLSQNINKQSPWMLFLEIFGSVCAAAAAAAPAWKTGIRISLRGSASSVPLRTCCTYIYTIYTIIYTISGSRKMALDLVRSTEKVG